MALTAKRMRRGVVPQARRSQPAHMPAPVGGLNTVSAASAMPASDCLYLYNLIPYQYGLRNRSGYRDWVTGAGPASSGDGLYEYGSPLTFTLAGPLGGSVVGGWVADSPLGVRSILPFAGSKSDGANDRLWAAAIDGIYDATSSTASPTRVLTFDATGISPGPPDAGVGSGTTFVNRAGGHFYLYCDGFHGYHVYSEGTQAWTKITKGTTPGTQVYSYDEVNWPLPDPSTFRFVTIWKNRVWFVPENSGTAWYLETGSFTGVAYPIPFAPRFRSGGELAGLFSWTVDGGAGVDDMLVGISRGGDVVIYQGTDPALPGAFALRGVWWVGQVPPGRRFASQFGGDLFILSVAGCVPLSKLVSGGQLYDPNIMASAKVSNLFNALMSERGTLRGWSIAIHPTDNLLVVNVPPTPSAPGQQLTMSLANQGWSQHYGVPIQCMGTWRNKLYFGTVDSKVCIHDGTMDGADLTGTTARPIDWGLQTAYQMLGDPSKKRVHMLRPHFMTDGTPPGSQCAVRFDFDLAPISILPLDTEPVQSAWDAAVWDTSVWGGATGKAGHYVGALGMGSHVSVLMRGVSTSRTTFVGFDAIVEKGGLL